MKAITLLLSLSISGLGSAGAQQDSSFLLNEKEYEEQVVTKTKNPMMRGSAASAAYSAPDNHVQTLEITREEGRDIETLSRLLTAPFDNDSLKMRAIFYWTASNLAYDVKKYHCKKGVPFKCYCKNTASRFEKVLGALRLRKKSGDDHSRCIEKWHWELAREALINKKGVCMDYALVFYYLCHYAGIECRYVGGYVSNGTSRLSSGLSEKASNHAWNAVKLNDNWYLLDVTWASGYCDKKVKTFTLELSEDYYLPSPEQMILTHHPSQQKWQLLNKPVKMKEFVQRANERMAER